MTDHDFDQDDLDDLRAEDNARRRYHNQLMQHPNPQDPDHPGEDE